MRFGDFTRSEALSFFKKLYCKPEFAVAKVLKKVIRKRCAKNHFFIERRKNCPNKSCCRHFFHFRGIALPFFPYLPPVPRAGARGCLASPDCVRCADLSGVTKMMSLRDMRTTHRHRFHPTTLHDEIHGAELYSPPAIPSRTE